MKSICALILSFILMLFAVTWYFPRYNQSGSAAVIAWDVSGYYMYLPAIFIYHDLKYLKFEKEIVEKYHHSDNSFQGAEQPNGGKVLQYTCGMAIMYSPFFFIAHVYANLLGYPADGFSIPYQFAIGFGSLLIALIGLFYLRKFLLRFFSDGATAITILAIAIGSNYFEYSSISGGLTHNYLFTLYAILLWCSIKFWKKPSLKFSLLIGLFAGLLTIIRPTEIISFIIPILIGIKSWKELVERIKFLFRKFSFLLIAVIPVIGFGVFQLCYWKYVSGHWIIYSYQDQVFDWFNPQINKGMFSYRAGWLIYTPIMIFSLIGFFFLYKLKKEFFWFSILFSIVFIYLCFAWSIWYYSGSFGIRAMVQSYAILAIPFTAFNEWMLKRKWKVILFSSFMLFFTYYNIWLTHQAHKGGLLTIYGMTKAYFWKIFLRYDVPIETRYFLDCSERFDGEPKNNKTIFFTDFENDSLKYNQSVQPIDGENSLYIDKTNSYFDICKISFPTEKYNWIRVSLMCSLKWKEYCDWNMTQLIIKLYDANNLELKKGKLLIQHVMNENETKTIHLDLKLPKENIDSVHVFFYKGNSWPPVGIDDLKVEVFNE